MVPAPVPRRCSSARQNIDLNGIALGAARFTNAAALLAMPIFNAGRTQAINDIAESGQKEAVLRYEDGIVRALEDVENALVALRDERQRSDDTATRRRFRRRPRSAAPARSTTAARSTCCRCSTPSARASPCASAPTTADTQLLLDSVQLYKALGGGWQAVRARRNRLAAIHMTPIMKPPEEPS